MVILYALEDIMVPRMELMLRPQLLSIIWVMRMLQVIVMVLELVKTF